MRSAKKILIVSGEPSGDLHASNLVKELKTSNPDLEFFGIGGSLSKEAGVRILYDIKELALVGLVEVLRNISVVSKAYKGVIREVDLVRPDLAILVDYPGFNLRLARGLKKRSVPVAYYISPQVWAWGENRIEIIRGCVKKLVVFFKFEEELYKRRGIDAEFVGHPILDIAKVTLSKDETLERYGLSSKKSTLALLPGSRVIEVKALLPVMLSACKIVSARLGNVQFAVAKFKDLPKDLYETEIGKAAGLDVKLIDGDTYNILGASDFAIVASGTATLEAAIIGTPFLITYKVHLLTYLLYHIVATTRFVGLVNIIAQKELIPELLQFDARPEKIAALTVSLAKDKDKLARMREGLKSVATSLGPPGANSRAARAILPLIQ